MGRGRRDKVILSVEERKNLEAISRNGYAPALKILHAQILLMSDEGEKATEKWTDEEIASALNMHRNTVARVRKKFLNLGIVPALERKLRRKPPVEPIVDGDSCCSNHCSMLFLSARRESALSVFAF